MLATRRGKPEVEGERFDAAWKAEATAAGWGPDAAEALIAVDQRATRRPASRRCGGSRTIDDRTGVVVDRHGGPRGVGRRAGPGVTEHDSTFTRPELVQAVAARIGEGATVATVDRIVARVMASAAGGPDRRRPDRAVDHGRAAGRGAPVPAHRRDHPWHTTPGRRRRRRSGARRVRRRSARIRSGGADADRDIDAVAVMVGPAGTGKTYTLDAVRARRSRPPATTWSASHPRRGRPTNSTPTPTSSRRRSTGCSARGPAATTCPTPAPCWWWTRPRMAGIRDLEQVVAAGGRGGRPGDPGRGPPPAPRGDRRWRVRGAWRPTRR